MLGTTGVFAQFSFGVQGRATADELLSSGVKSGWDVSSNATQFTVGPTVKMQLPAGLGLEADALFRHFQYNGSTNLVDELVRSGASNAWEFPLLLKYRTPGIFVKPFLDDGVAFDHWSGTNQIVAAVTGTGSTSGTSAQTLASCWGPVLNCTCRWSGSHRKSVTRDGGLLAQRTWGPLCAPIRTRRNSWSARHSSVSRRQDGASRHPPPRRI